MSDYFLFIDTEASGLPKNWSVPYTAVDNWPHAVQVSWIIYNHDREEIKRQDHYIRNTDFEISESALRVHGITDEYLAQHGKSRSEVMNLLVNDMLRFRPMVIGHFIKLDYYVISADLHRAGIDNPLHTLPVFCTMLASKYLARNPMPRQLRLDELYRVLFYKELEGQHNALVDTEATAECYFELLNRGEITSKLIDEQNAEAAKWRNPTGKNTGCVLPALLVVLIGILIFYLV
ncbi:hypothetical protein GCM10023149_39780 [Mucilaginibacter gynuensis]|uniref:Exonuclease domain-containing protein n=1 Tax=Mucilaginibacter gynuensis TaxID=1302236 RepID=A0ABP8H1Y6_9SPHI